jgi:hypothetical protein
MADQKTVTLTQEQFDQLLAASSRAHAAPAPDVKNEEELYADALARQGIVAPPVDRTPHGESHVPCHNRRNGATFTARVARSSTHESGRVLDLLDYRYPDDIEDRAKGMAIRNQKTGQLSREFKQWRWEQYDQADRKAFVGFAADELPSTGPAVPVKFDGVAMRRAG